MAALTGNSTGSTNTASGSNSLINNTTGSENTAVGVGSLHSNSTGSNNTAIGVGAGTGSATNLSNSTAIGALAEVDLSNAMVLGSINGVNGATADTKVGIGTTAPTYKLHVGIINNGFRVEGPPSATANPLAVSFGGNGDFQIDAPGTVSGRFVVKDGGLVGIQAPAPSNVFTIGRNAGHAIADGWDTYSSRRWKTNVQQLQGALGKVQHLRGVSYELKASGKHEIGVIAEEVGQVVPEVVSYEKNGKDAQGVDYSRLTALLIEAVKEQQREITRQQHLVSAQQRLTNAQQREIARLNRKVGALEVGLRTTTHGEKPSVLMSGVRADSARPR